MGDWAAIMNLMNQYTFLIDSGDFEGFAALFDRGAFRIVGSSAEDAVGAAAVATAITGQLITYDGVPRTHHLTTNVSIDIATDRQTAVSRCYVTVLQAVPPDFPLQVIFAGFYSDRFVRDENGWYFVERCIRRDLVGDMSRHRLFPIPQ